jgi:hypothetical protein
MTNFPRVSLDDIDRWMEYFRNHVPMTAQTVSNAREMLIEWLRRIGALPPE